MTQRLDDHDLLARLVAFETVSQASTVPLAEFIGQYMEGAGAAVRRLPGPHPDKVNLLCRMGPEPGGGEGLTLCGHLDVVPADEPGWTGHPFTLRRRDDGTLVGRGACDMKGFIAVAMNLMADAAAMDLPRPVYLLLTCDEELGSIGARHLAEHWPADQPIAAATIVGEPTSLRAVRLHKGHLGVRVSVAGRSAHTGSPHMGHNAVEPLGPILMALSSLRREWAGQRPPNYEHFARVPFHVLAPARVHGGVAVNVIPDKAVLELGVRTLPGTDSRMLARLVTSAVRAAVPQEQVEVELLNDNPPLELPEDAPIHRELCRHLDQPGSLGVSYASDAGHLRRLGLDCVLFGPGSIEVAHRPDEFVPVAELARCRQVLQQLLEVFCRQGAGQG